MYAYVQINYVCGWFGQDNQRVRATLIFMCFCPRNLEAPTIEIQNTAFSSETFFLPRVESDTFQLNAPLKIKLKP